jgi:hypothetical protein
MARKAGPSDEDYGSAARLGLLGVTRGEDADVDSIMEQLAVLHPRNNTFPAEVLLELAAEAIEESGASLADPINYQGATAFSPNTTSAASPNSTRVTTP